MADRLKGRGTAMTGKTGRLPRRTALGVYLGGDEAAAAEEAYQRLQEAFARPLPLPLHDARFGYGNGGATHDEQLSEGDQDVGGLLRDHFAREQSPAPKGARLGTAQAATEPLEDHDTSVLSDVARGGAAGVRLGAEGLAGTFGDLNQMRGDLAAYTADKVFGASPETQQWISEKFRRMKIPLLPDMSMAPTSDELHQATTSLIGESYQPRTTWGGYSRTFGELLPNLVGGGGKLIPRLLKDVVLPGLASETAGQLVEGTFLEPYVRGAAEMLTPLASSGIRRTMMPGRASPRPNAVVNSATDVDSLAGGREAMPVARMSGSKKGDRVRQRRRGRGITGYGTHERTPGLKPDHLPAVAAGDERVRVAYAAGPGSWWQRADGRDQLHASQPGRVDVTEPTIGVYEEQFNPGQAAKTRVHTSGPKGRRVVDKPSKRKMMGTEGFRAYIDAQDAGAWTAIIRGQTIRHNNAYKVTLPEGMRTPEGLRAVREAARMPHIIHLGGPDVIVTDFGSKAGLSARESRVVDERVRALTGSGAVPVRREGDIVSYEKQWLKGEGSEAATRKMLHVLDDDQIQAFDTPEIRQVALNRFEQDASESLRLGTPLRQDIQMARWIFGHSGFKGLRDALGKGILPAAAVTLFLGYSHDDQS